MLLFLESSLDATFLTLLSSSPASPASAFLHSLSQIITPELDLTIQLGDLSGMLEPFSKKEIRRKREEERERREKEEGVERDRKEKESVARRGMRDDGAAVKVYQLEELEI